VEEEASRLERAETAESTDLPGSLGRAPVKEDAGSCIPKDEDSAAEAAANQILQVFMLPDSSALRSSDAALLLCSTSAP